METENKHLEENEAYMQSLQNFRTELEALSPEKKEESRQQLLEYLKLQRKNFSRSLDMPHSDWESKVRITNILWQMSSLITSPKIIGSYYKGNEYKSPIEKIFTVLIQFLQSLPERIAKKDHLYANLSLDQFYSAFQKILSDFQFPQEEQIEQISEAVAEEYKNVIVPQSFPEVANTLPL